MAAVVVAVEASKKMELKIEGFDKIERMSDGSGKSFLVGRRTITQQDFAAGNFVPSAKVTISGLPRRPASALFVVAIAVVTFLGAFAYALSRRKPQGFVVEAREDLEEAKRALLNEFVTLERARERGDVGPKSYERIRQQLLDALGRIVERLDELHGPKAAPAGFEPDSDEEGDDDDDEKVRPPAKRGRSKRLG